MTNYNHYEQSKIIAGQIEIEGFHDLANKIRYVIENGKSGTEIFMQLRYYLSPLEDNLQIKPATRTLISILINKINEALNR